MPQERDTPTADTFFSENYVDNSNAFKKCMRECNELSMMGFAHNRMVASYAPELIRLLRKGGKLKVLAMEPSSSAVLEANARSFAPKSTAAARHQHNAAIAALKAVGKNASDVSQFELRLIKQSPPFTVYLFDELELDLAQAFVWLTPWRRPSSERPGFRLVASESPKWHAFFADQLHELWALGKTQSIE
jgi:hypothetical protein